MGLMLSRTTAKGMIAAFGAALAMVLIVRLTAAPADKLIFALKATARWSFILFWLATTGGALVTLFGSTFAPLAARARDFGLAFASAHLGHLGLVAWLCYFYGGLGLPLNIFFGVGIFWVYLLAALSFPQVSVKFSSRTVRILRNIGVEYIALVFIFDFVKNEFQDGFLNLMNYLPFQVLAIAGPLLRFAALAKRVTHARKLAASSARG
jgi:hypothetical protein